MSLGLDGSGGWLTDVWTGMLGNSEAEKESEAGQSFVGARLGLSLNIADGEKGSDSFQLDVSPNITDTLYAGVSRA
jgi:hypothetical protein